MPNTAALLTIAINVLEAAGFTAERVEVTASGAHAFSAESEGAGMYRGPAGHVFVRPDGRAFLNNHAAN